MESADSSRWHFFRFKRQNLENVESFKTLVQDHLDVVIFASHAGFRLASEVNVSVVCNSVHSFANVLVIFHLIHGLIFLMISKGYQKSLR